MNDLEKIIPQNTLNIQLTRAKIRANPYDYTLTSRLLFVESTHEFNKFNMFNMSYTSEYEISNRLSYMPNLNSFVFRDELNVIPIRWDKIKSVVSNRIIDGGGQGYLFEHNNHILNTTEFISDIGYVHGNYNEVLLPSEIRDIAKYACVDSYILEALECLHLKCISKDSLIPQLMYLMTSFKDIPLNDLVTLKPFKDLLASKEAPLFAVTYMMSSVTAIECEAFYISTCEYIYDSEDISAYTRKESTRYIEKTLSLTDEEYDSIYRVGMAQVLCYGCEVLYQLNNINTDHYLEALAKLFALDFNKNSYVAKYLYDIIDDKIVINEDLIACFHRDNKIRFKNFKHYIDKAFKSAIFSYKTPYKTHRAECSVPLCFAKIIAQMHYQAYKKMRVEILTLLFLEAKKHNVLDNKGFEQYLEEIGERITFEDIEASDAFKYEPDLSLLDLTDVTYPDNFEEIQELSTKKDFKVTKPPMLSELDALKSLDKDKVYNYDIKPIKSVISNSNADKYNTIAASVKMITHNLTKQIKNIKTYNSGGKHSGLNIGKLDRKNLWKYRTEHNIFYNNTYKVKEMDLAFGCILDESGSMSGTSIHNGKIVMIMLHEVLSSLGINHNIIGHTSTGYHQCIIHKYYNFKEEHDFFVTKPYSLLDIKAYRGNCDSGALAYMQQVMKTVPNKDKIVLIFSDGQPTECSDNELINQIRVMEKEGIHVIGIGINFEEIKHYYSDYANGKNLKDMTEIIVNILKRYVLEKE